MALWKQILVGDEAIRHGSEIVALTAYQAAPPPLSFGTDSVHEAQSAGEAASKSAKHLLLETIRDVLGEDPPVLVQPRVKEGNAAKLLIDLSGKADVLVVGTRGRGGFAELLSGPVSQNVAAYAKCTVVVAR